MRWAGVALLRSSGCVAGPVPADDPGGPAARTWEPQSFGFEDASPWSGLAWQAPAPDEPAGLERIAVGGGGALHDFDGDGHLDVLLTAIAGPNALFRGLGDGSFEELHDTGVESGESTFGATAADLDGDGLPDLLLPDGQRLRVLLNQGGGNFDELPPALEVGLDEGVVNAALVDFDGDGFVDVHVSVVGNWGAGEEPFGGRDRLLRGRGDGAFEDVSSSLGPEDARVGMTFVGTWLDFDEDGDLDLYVVNEKGSMTGPNRLFLQEPGGFEEVAAQRGLDLAFDGMGVAVADLDNDGCRELAMSDTRGRVRIVELMDGMGLDVGAAYGSFDEPVAQRFAAWGLRFADFDNDGNEDLLTTWGHFEPRLSSDPNYVTFQRYRDGQLQDDSGLLPPLGSHTWRSVLPGDLDGDGVLDFVQIPLAGAPGVVLGRDVGAGWIEVELVGGEGNRDGLGALVEVEIGGRLERHRMEAGASGSQSSVEPVMHVGLGAATEVDRVVVTWPSGDVTVVEQPPVDARLIVSRD